MYTHKLYIKSRWYFTNPAAPPTDGATPGLTPASPGRDPPPSWAVSGKVREPAPDHALPPSSQCAPGSRALAVRCPLPLHQRLAIIYTYIWMCICIYVGVC